MSTHTTPTPETFKAQLATLTSQLQGRPLNAELDEWLNQAHGAGSETYDFKPGPELHGFSVDVVDMNDVAGPHHTHPNGEIDLIMPLKGEALFDGRPAGWMVCAPGSAHSPTVTQGRALVLYLLPDGQIKFTR